MQYEFPAVSLRQDQALALMEGPLNFSIDLQDVAVRISEEQGAVPKWLVSGSRNDADPALLQSTRAVRILAWRDTECELQR